MEVRVLADIVIVTGSVFVSVGIIFKAVRISLEKLFDEKLGSIDKKLMYIDESATKNFIVRCLNDMEDGRWINETTWERLNEAYDHYTNDLNLNSYIHIKWDSIVDRKRSDVE